MKSRDKVVRFFATMRYPSSTAQIIGGIDSNRAALDQPKAPSTNTEALPARNVRPSAVMT